MLLSFPCARSSLSTTLFHLFFNLLLSEPILLILFLNVVLSLATLLWLPAGRMRAPAAQELSGFTNGRHTYTRQLIFKCLGYLKGPSKGTPKSSPATPWPVKNAASGYPLEFSHADWLSLLRLLCPILLPPVMAILFPFSQILACSNLKALPRLPLAGHWPLAFSLIDQKPIGDQDL